MYCKKLFFTTVVPLAIAITPLAASAQATCCGDKPSHHDKGCCAEMTAPCCPKGGTFDGVAILMTLDQPAPPVRQTAVVRFQRPVKVRDRILLGKYVIEHDNDRMARGVPCTYIYAANNLRVPVVAFHCTHLTRPRAERDSVVVWPLGEATGMATLASFQFAGETAAHGFPHK